MEGLIWISGAVISFIALLLVTRFTSKIKDAQVFVSFSLLCSVWPVAIILCFSLLLVYGGIKLLMLLFNAIKPKEE